MAMIARRLLFYLVTLWAAVSVNFMIPRLMPGTALDSILGRFQGQLTGRSMQALEAAFGLDHRQSEWAQYWTYLWNVLHGNLGVSTNYFPSTVASVVDASMPWTVILIGVTTVVAFVVGTLFGIVAGWRRGTVWESVIPIFGLLSSMPYFWFGQIAVALLAVQLDWFPFSGGYAPSLQIGWSGAFIASALYHAILPALTIVVSSLGGWALGMRNMMATTLSENYVMLARAKGLKNWRVVLLYAARNAILPNIASFALSLGFIVSGAVLVEVVFSYPGIGFVLYNAVTTNDYPLMQGIFLVIVVTVLLANLAADVVYLMLDPRTRRDA